MDDVERDDLGYSETDMTGNDWAEPLQSLRAEREPAGEPAEDEDESIAADEGLAEDEGALKEELALESAVAAERLG